MQLELIASVLQTKDTRIFVQLRQEWFDDDTLQIYSFIQKYVKLTGRLPEIKTVEAEFEIALPEVAEPPEYWIDKVSARYREIVTEEAIKKAVQRKSLDPFYEAIKQLSTVSDIEGYYEDALIRWEQYLERKDADGITYLPTGHNILDRAFFGYKRGDYILVGGNEAVGKTWFMLRRANDLNKIINRVTTEANGRYILFFTVEMPADELKERLDAINAKISYNRLILGKLREDEEQRYNQLLDWQAKRKKYDRLRIITDAYTVKDIEKYIIGYQPAMIFIDGIHLISKSFDWKDMMTTSLQLRRLAMYYKLPIMVSAHLRNDNNFAYFRGSRDATLALVLKKDEEMELNNQYLMEIVKGRKGQKGTVLFENNYENSTEEVVESSFDDEEPF